MRIDQVSTVWGVLVLCKSRSTAARLHPYAGVIAKVDGGFLVFETDADYKAWRAIGRGKQRGNRGGRRRHPEMTMRCWPGCLAYLRQDCEATNVLTGERITIAPAGTVVTCVTMVDGPSWTVEKPITMTVTFRGHPQPVKIDVLAFLDAVLTPIVPKPQAGVLNGLCASA